jgi:hypothetical protein
MVESPSQGELTREAVVALVEEARMAEGELVLSGYDLSGVDLSGLNLGRKGVVWRDVVFGRHNGPPPAEMNGTSFRDSTFDHCFFAHANFTDADFRACVMSRCDFRYAQFHRTTVEEATFNLCDLYRATCLQGTIFRQSVFELVSLTASLEGATDLRWPTFAGKGRPPALVPEDEDKYREFLEWTKHDRGDTYSTEDALNDRLLVAAEGYRNVSGLWTSRGQFGDASRAYVRARRLERQSASWRFKGKPFQPFRWMGLWLADLLCGFGTNLGIILPWLVIVALLPGFAYSHFGGISGDPGVGDSLLFSVSRIVGSTPTGLAPSSHVVDVVGVLQTLAGIALTGLFGFVLANKLRSS